MEKAYWVSSVCLGLRLFLVLAIYSSAPQESMATGIHLQHEAATAQDSRYELGHRKPGKRSFTDDHNQIKLNRCTALGLVVYNISFKWGRTRFVPLKWTEISRICIRQWTAFHVRCTGKPSYSAVKLSLWPDPERRFLREHSESNVHLTFLSISHSISSD